MKDVVVIVGPTAVGKTKLGVQLAKKLNGEVISGDSMQIYKHMDIGTAKVTQEEMEGVVHHLIDFKEIDESYSVSEFQRTVREKIDEISARHHLPIIVGGTGLYIKAALYDYVFNEEENKEHINYDDYSNEQLYAKLVEIDPASAKELHPNNRRRVARALEIAGSGTKKSELLEKQEHLPLYHIYMIGLTLPRDLLYERINLRVDLMFKAGLQKEFNQLIQLGAKPEYQSMKAIGYQEFFQEGDTVELIKKHSRNLAKRQYTWFKNQFDVHWISVNLDCFDETIENALNYIQYGQYYRYIAFNYMNIIDESGILEIKEGYVAKANQNPSHYEINHELNGVKHLVRIYYDESKITLESLINKYQPSQIYSKKSWNQPYEVIDKFYEL